MNFLRKLVHWVKTVYSEPTGEGSSTRVHIGVLVLFVICVGTYFVHLVATKRMTHAEFDLFLGAAGGFLTTVCGVLYGANKAADVMKSKG